MPAANHVEEPRLPARKTLRVRSPPGSLDPEGHRRPEEGQCPDGSRPSLRHARDPRCRLKSSGMLSAPGLRNRIGSPLADEPASRAVRKSWHRSQSVMRAVWTSEPRPGAPFPPPLVEKIPAPSPGGDARLIYQMWSAGQSPGHRMVATAMVRAPRNSAPWRCIGPQTGASEAIGLPGHRRPDGRRRWRQAAVS
jgi:hypothetical protein